MLPALGVFLLAGIFLRTCGSRAMDTVFSFGPTCRQEVTFGKFILSSLPSGP
jgi:hypothetical protein